MFFPPSSSSPHCSPGPKPLWIPRQDCKGEAAVCRWEQMKDPAARASPGLTHLFRYQEVIAKGLSGAGSTQQEDEHEVQKPPAKTPRVEQSLHPRPQPSPTQPSPLSPRVPVGTCLVRRKEKGQSRSLPRLSEGVFSTLSLLAYLLLQNVSLFCLFLKEERRAVVLGVGSGRPLWPLGCRDSGRQGRPATPQPPFAPPKNMQMTVQAS